MTAVPAFALPRAAALAGALLLVRGRAAAHAQPVVQPLPAPAQLRLNEALRRLARIRARSPR